MAELSVGTLQMTITADGSAAISEIERVGSAAQGAASGVAGGMAEAAKATEGAMSGAADAAEAAGEAGAQAGEKAAQGAEKAHASLEKVGQTLASVGEKATKFVTLPVVAAFTASVKGASDLVETVGKTEVVFDRLSDKVMHWSENSVQAMGLAQGSALEYASTFGDMGKGMGLALDTATEMSMNLTQLAADLASFKNIRTDVAAQKLNAVYTGETEGLKSLGIVMTQTNLQAFALSQGITKQVSAMSQAEQVALRYRYVMSVTKDAQGDFARTGDSLANQTRKLTETLKQAGESFGSQLIPMITPVVQKLQAWIQHLSELDTRTKNIIISVAMVAAAVGPLLLVGGKLLTFLATLKASLAALSINPVLLAIGAVAAAAVAIVGINKALNRTSESVDDTSDSYKRMKAAVEKGATGKVTIDKTELDNLPDSAEIAITGKGQAALDTAQEVVNELTSGKYDGKIAIDGSPEKAKEVLQQIGRDIEAAKHSVIITANGEAVIGDAGLLEQIEKDIESLEAVVVITDDPKERAELLARIADLKRQLTDLKNPTITITANGQEALDEAQEIADSLANGDYDGEITIDGEPALAKAKLDEIGRDIEALKKSVTITGNGEAVIGDAGLIAKIQADLDALEGMVVITEDPEARAKLEKQIADLKGQLEAALGNVKVTYNTVGEAEMQHFRDQLDKLPKNEEYSATGKFVYPEATQEAIDQYVLALGAAASATGDYKTAVESLNDIVDSDAQRKIAEVQRQGTEAAMEQARMLNSGVIDRETYDAEMKRIADDMTAETKRIQDQAEALKKTNEIFADGTRSNDYGAFGEGILQASGGQGITQKDTATAMERLRNAYDGGGDMTKESTAGLETLNGLLAQSTEQYNQLTAAVDTYNSAVSQADMEQQNAEAKYGAQIDAYANMADALDLYLNALSAGQDKQTAWETTLESLGDSLDPAMLEQFAEGMHDSSGELLDYADGLGALAALQDKSAEAQQKLGEAQDNAAKAREAAEGDLQAAVQSVEQMSGMDANALDTALNLAAQAGAAVSEADREAVVGGQQIITDLASTLESGGGDIAAAINTAVSDVAGLQAAIGTTVSQAATGAGSTAESGGEGVGGNLAAGIKKGIQNGSGDVAAAGRQMIRDALSAMRAEAQIASPSRKTRDIVGRNLALGIGAGYELETPNVVRIVRRSTEKLISGAAEVVNRGAYAVPATAVATAAGINYEAMGDAMERAMGRVRFGFNVGSRQLAEAQREHNAQQLAVQSRRVANRYGG